MKINLVYSHPSFFLFKKCLNPLFKEISVERTKVSAFHIPGSFLNVNVMREEIPFTQKNHFISFIFALTIVTFI